MPTKYASCGQGIYVDVLNAFEAWCMPQQRNILINISRFLVRDNGKSWINFLRLFHIFNLNKD